ncbi:MAG: DNA translocase FtsK 4TM domain-containing protein [Chitinophagales bacterium]|nr:DNA translocase FtsK 4TM domain-containing protein [Chitinophagales bacterium]
MSDKKGKEKTKKEKGPGFFARVKMLLADERVPKIIGLTFMFASVLLLVAFISYLFNWRADQFIPVGERAINNIGQLGAFVADKFFRNGFGLTSFVLVPVLFLTGVRFLNSNISLPLRSTYQYAFLSLLWFPLAFAFIFSSPSISFPFGGAFGEYLDTRLESYVGWFGTLMLTVFSMLVFLVVRFNINFNIPSFASIKERVKRVQVPEIKVEEETDVQHWEEQIVAENKEAVLTDVVEFETPVTPAKTKEKVKPDLSLEVVETLGETANVVNGMHPEPIDDDLPLDVVETEEEVILPESLKINYDPTLDLPDYKYPPLELLRIYSDEKITIDREELEKNKDQIIQTLRNYAIEISSIKATVGPTVTLYEIVPAAGVRISKIKNLEDDIALSLAALGIRIIAPIPGKGTIGIEVPNVKKEIVSMRSLLASEKFQTTKYDLPIALGKNIANEIFVEDLAKMPHMLVAGATGQGKSVGLNAILISLLYKKHPSQLKFVLIDPKMVELSIFKIIEKHFLAKLPNSEEVIITDTKRVIHTLNALCIEMDDRFALLTKCNARNLKEYNAKFVARRLNPLHGHKFLPYIVLVIDEFADLIMTAGKEIETPIARLAQKARAIGIHLIIATQRPSVNIITGTIKANFPARIAFKVTAKVDSRTILDVGGADQLIGRGDMLLSNGSELTRLQCAFVDTPEVEDVVNYIGKQQSYPDAFQLPEYIDDKEDAGGMLDPNDRDDKFEEAARMIVTTQQGSTSLLQRRLNLGYNRAGRLMDQLEQAGVVGPSQGSKPREVLFHDLMQLEQFLNQHA